jgi:hypothetical protein
MVNSGGRMSPNLLTITKALPTPTCLKLKGLVVVVVQRHYSSVVTRWCISSIMENSIAS